MKQQSSDGEAFQKFLKTLLRLIRGFLQGGLYGAIVATAKEALPFLIKLVAGIVVVCIIVPSILLVSVPSMFFGFESSTDPKISNMTDQAMTIGTTFMSIETLILTRMNQIADDLEDDYEDDETTVDDVEVSNTISSSDINWIVAICSVWFGQDVTNTTSTEVQQFIFSFLQYTAFLQELEQTDTVKNILKVNFTILSVLDFMANLTFTQEQMDWATCIYETLEESNAMTQYKFYFLGAAEGSTGDGGYSGGIQLGGTRDTSIPLSVYDDPTTKTGQDLANYAIHAWNCKWGYVWGTFGHVLTQGSLDSKANQYPDGVGNHRDFISQNWVGGRTTDCAGLVKGYCWYDPVEQVFAYGTNGMPDYTADDLYLSSPKSGPMSTMPDIPGIVLWKPGHMGVYIGDGQVIEAMYTQVGVVKTELGNRWNGWCQPPGISYP